ncbi:MAG: helicase-related protein [Pirellulales bacterium]
MTTSDVKKPDANSALAGLKDFQLRTVDYAFRRLYTDADSTHRFLVADEVGLGKTLIARGVIAKAVEHLWDKVDRVDVVYVCSNADIARQNIDRLRVDRQHDFARATRATLLPLEMKDITHRKVNYVSMTPGTSLEPLGGTGIVKERALLFAMLRDHWKLQENRAMNVLRCGVTSDNFAWWINWIKDQEIDVTLRDMFLEKIDKQRQLDYDAGRADLQTRFVTLCEDLPRRDSKLDENGRDERRRLVAELRALLGRTCIHALRPDLVILDEFQRFKHLLDPNNEEAELAKSLFEYADDREGNAEAVRVLLLSATPYKMYSMQHEQDNGESDHYEDFIATYDFLARHDEARNACLRGLLKDYRAAMFRLGDGAFDELRRIKSELEQCLQRVMARTERLAVTNDRSGMLREQKSQPRLEDSDVRQYLAVAKVAALLEHGDIVEYWKSAPYLLNFMDDYQLKRALREIVEDGETDEIAKALAAADGSLLRWEDVQAYRQIDPANARLRSLLNDTVDRGLWKLLWLPPSLPYYQMSGAFVGFDPVAVTKRLVFSSWKVVPKVIAAVLSHEAERRAIGLLHGNTEGDISVDNSTDGRKKIAALLRFSRADNRLTGMPVLGLIYPSKSLAMAFDPAAAGEFPPTRDEMIARACDALAPMIETVTARWAGEGDVDERWYWAAPILMDLAQNAEDTHKFWDRVDLAAEWSGEEGETAEADGENEPETAWEEHVEQARTLIRDSSVNGRRPLGRPPSKLLEVLSKSALGNPAVVALRSISRVIEVSRSGDDLIRLAAGRVAWRLRNLFNLPEVISLVRGLNCEEPFWLRVIEYAADGCLQAVLDEYAHVLRDCLGVGALEPVEAANKISNAMCAAVGLRSAAVGVDEIRVKGNGRSHQIKIVPRRMRARFAARFGQDKTEKDGDVARADIVRAAFNSPFWPFVLASTSVGQEGLDFHHYCHAIMHWNLPSNPVDLEQREGRIHRYKGHAVRKNVALKHGAELAVPFSDRWKTAFERAEVDRDISTSELVPYWVFPHENGAVIERHVPALPLSRDADRLAQLRGSLALYRMVFGQPRQDELVNYLLARLPQDAVDQIVKDLRIDLEPPRGIFTSTDREPTMAKLEASG